MPERLQYPHFAAYRMEDIQAEIGDDAFATFCEWMDGQTRPLDEQEPTMGLVYAWDYDRWRESSGRGEHPLVWD